MSKLLSFRKDVELTWKAAEMLVNLYEYLSHTDGSTVELECSKNIYTAEIQPMKMYGDSCARSVCEASELTGYQSRRLVRKLVPKAQAHTLL